MCQVELRWRAASRGPEIVARARASTVFPRVVDIVKNSNGSEWGQHVKVFFDADGAKCRLE